VLIAACKDRHTVVAAAAITALGHLGDLNGRGVVVERAGDVAGAVRFAAAVALPMLAADPADAEVVSALIRLSTDPDRDVRDWATMGLGSQLEVDTTAVREALVARLQDSDADTAGEALVGLSRRKDPRALPALLVGQTRGPSTSWVTMSSARLQDSGLSPR
jgi:HEAT repeat protein